MRSPTLIAAAMMCAATVAQAQVATPVSDSHAAVAVQPPGQRVIEAVKNAPPAVVSGSVNVSPAVSVPATPSGIVSPTPVSATIDASTTAGVTTLDEAFAAISESAATQAVEQETTLGLQGEKLEDYMKDAARPANEAASDIGVIPMPPDGDDMMGY